MTRLPYPSSSNFMLNQVAHTNKLRKEGLGQPKQSLSQLIRLLQNFDYTDLFDRVYGLLGIVTKPDDKSLYLKADYSLSREDMFFNVLEYVKLADTEPKDKDEHDSFVNLLESALGVYMRRDYETREDYGRLLLLNQNGRAYNLYESKPRWIALELRCRSRS